MAKRRKNRAQAHRWTNRRSDGTYVSKGDNWTRWRNEVCPTCGRKYRYFRAELVDTAYHQLRSEQDKGDRSQLNLRTVLGRRHEIKQRAWEVHKEICALYAVELAGEKVGEDVWQEAFGRDMSDPGYFVDCKGNRVDTFPQVESETTVCDDEDDEVPF